MIVLTDRSPRAAAAPAASAGTPPVKQPPLAVQVVEAVESGRLKPEDAWALYGITPEAIAMWQRARDSVGILTAVH